MTPKSSFMGRFSNEGRIKNLWAQALEEPDPQTSLSQLREVRRRLHEDPGALYHHWLPFLQDFFDRPRLHRLTSSDLLAVEDMGNVLAQGFARPLRPEDIWFPVLNVYMELALEVRVRALLTRIYVSPSAVWDEKARCARELARRRDMSESALSIYIDFLQNTPTPGAESEMTGLLSDVCAVDFTTERAGLERAGMVAQRLISGKISLPMAGLWNAVAIYALLIQRAPTQALHYFGYVLHANPQDRIALIGTLACRIDLGQHELINEMARMPLMSNFARDPIVAGLLQLSSIIDWLDNPDRQGALSGSIQALEMSRNLGLRNYVGDMVDATLGRLYLLAGDARRASALLSPLLSTNRQFPHWAYYAAWAEMLLGNRDGVVYCFSNIARWSGRWAVACLLIDTDPALAEKSGAFSFLRGILSSPMQVKQSYLPIIQSRLALAQSREPAPVTWKRDTSSIEEDIEALRTIIGYCCYSRNIEGMGRWLTHPLFARLPLADQLLWRGLHGLYVTGQAQQGLALLIEAATRYRYYRAALVLTLHYLGMNQFGEAKRYLQISATIRDDGRTAFLRAYIAGSEGQTEAALEQLEKVSYDPAIRAQAFYATGNLLLQKASQSTLSGQIGKIQNYRQQAIERLSSALLSGKDRLPGEAETVLHCAQFITQPVHQSRIGVSLWHELTHLDPRLRQPWLKWNALLGRLWYGKPDEVIAVASEIYPIMDSASRMGEHVAEVFAQALAAVSIRTEKAEHMEQLLHMLERLSTGSELASIRQTCQVGITRTLREHYKKADPEQRRQVRQEVMRRANTDRSNEALAMLLATTSIENGTKLVAVNTLRSTQSRQSSSRSLFPYLADVLDQSGQITHPRPEAESDSSPAIQRAYEMLHVAEAFTTKQTERGYEILNGLLSQHGSEIAPLVKIGHILPHLCAYATQTGGAVPAVITEMVRSFTSAPIEDRQRVLLARCATAIGELDEAKNLWESALKQEQHPSQHLRQEYARFLSHLAVNAHLAGDNREATRYLRQAAGWLKQERHL